MTMGESRSNHPLRDWGPLTDLFQKLPRKVHSGILSQELKILCIDVIPEFIALGTNAGLVFWYNRVKREIQRLQCEHPTQISSIKVISTVDYMLACGTTSGTINIFQIPKVPPEDIPENLKPKKQQVERYLVSDMHSSSISALEWAKNGMKLFSGDKEGIVVLTELDFYMHICKSVEILNESYEVVQLSYHHQNLLISTTYRSIICKKLEKWKITQVGKKGRKIFGNYGGIIHSDRLRPNHYIVYCTRPGLRIWISDMEGNVQKTILFKDALKKRDMYMTNMSSSVTPSLEDDVAFGILATFHENLLVTYCRKVLYVLDPQKMGVVHKFYSSKGILNVATSKEEIFILEENWNLVRLGYGPELINQETRFGLPVTVFPASMNILGLTLDGCSVTTGISESDGMNSTVINAEEAIECTGEETYFDDADTKLQSKNSAETISNTYSKISQEDYDDNIIYKHHRYSKSHSKSSASQNGLYHNNYKKASDTALSARCMTILPDLRSPESIKNDIETKEKLISDILNFDKIKIDMLRIEQDAVDNPQRKERNEDIQEYKSTDCDGLNLTKGTNEEKDLMDTSKRKFDTEEESDPPILFGINRTSQLQEDSNVKHANDKIDTETSICNGTPDTFKIPSDPLQIKHGTDLVSSIPDIMTIPSEWNLSCVELTHKERTITESDNSLNDWEII